MLLRCGKRRASRNPLLCNLHPSCTVTHNMFGWTQRLVWRGVAWRGVAWRGVAWHGVAWRGVTWILWCWAVRVGVVSWALRRRRSGVEWPPFTRAFKILRIGPRCSYFPERIRDPTDCFVLFLTAGLQDLAHGACRVARRAQVAGPCPCRVPAYPTHPAADRWPTTDATDR